MAIIQRFLVLLLVVISLTIYTIALHLEIALDVAVLLASVLTLIVVGLLERKIPYRKQWSGNHGDVTTDITSAGVLIAVIDPALKTLAPLAVVASYSAIGTELPASQADLWVQIAVALLLIELGKYWAHRLHHSFTPFWWLHAMHHSSQRLYFLNGLRFHPLNYALNFSFSILPAMLVGLSPEALLGYLAITQPVVLMQHANLDLQHGNLNKIFSTPEDHRWHHSTVPVEANRNFGNALLIWDHVFGTFKSESGFNDSKTVGLFSSSKAIYPATKPYFAQLVSMFLPPCCRAH